MILAHHGRPVEMPRGAQKLWLTTGGYDWETEARHYSKCLTTWLAEAFQDATTLPNAPAFHHFVAGLLSLADWVGSDATFFPFSSALLQNSDCRGFTL